MVCGLQTCDRGTAPSPGPLGLAAVPSGGLVREGGWAAELKSKRRPARHAAPLLRTAPLPLCHNVFQSGKQTVQLEPGPPASISTDV